MPQNFRELFDFVYGFPPANQMNPAGKYLVSFSSETTDGPNGVLPPFVVDISDLFYEFRLPQTAILESLRFRQTARQEIGVKRGWLQSQA